MATIRRIALLIVVSHGLVYGQPNLILNPSFELFDSCTTTEANIAVVRYWGNANSLTPDYFNPCNSGPVGVPHNFNGYQTAQHGNSYVGFVLNDFLQAREAIQGLISPPLVAHRMYCFEMYVNIADTVDYIVSELGVHLTTDTIYASDFTYNNYSLAPQIKLDVQGITDTSSWALVTGSYWASGGEDHLLISGFDNISFIKYRPSPVSDGTAYYNIDNVNLYDCTPPEAVVTNLLTPNGDGKNDLYVIINLPPQTHVSFFNRWGNELYHTADYQNDWDGTYMGNLLPTGTYYVVVTFPDGRVVSTFIELMY